MFQGVVLDLEDDLDLVGAVIITTIITITTITIIITTGKIGLLFSDEMYFHFLTIIIHSSYVIYV